jgi:hypothetical protein
VFLALGIIVAVVLIVSVYYFANKRKIERGRTKKLVQAYIKERAEDQISLSRELEKLLRLRENKEIDQETYERLKNVLVTMNDKKRKKGETKDLLDYVAKRT